MKMEVESQPTFASQEWMGTLEKIFQTYKKSSINGSRIRILSYYSLFFHAFRGMKFRLGICIPTALTRSDIPVNTWLTMSGKMSSWKDIKNGVDGVNGVVEAESLELLDSDDTKNVFFDREKR